MNMDSIVIAKKYAPKIVMDNNEPFLPVLVGYTITDKPKLSPSFKRELIPPAGGIIIEYAIYWDWDIGHHYDLEHLWVHVSREGKVECFEGSAHGIYLTLWPFPPTLEEVEYTLKNKEKVGGHCSTRKRDIDFSRIYSTGEGLIAYSQPGKHSFSPTPDWFKEQRNYVVTTCTENAGNDGLHGGVYGNILHKKDLDRDQLATDYLKKQAFFPSLIFDKIINLEIDIPLLSWEDLYRMIPERVDRWMTLLAAGEDEIVNSPNLS